jgi:hypothetical protein
VPTSKFTEERDIPKTKKAQFSPDDVIAGRSVTRLQKLVRPFFRPSGRREVQESWLWCADFSINLSRIGPALVVFSFLCLILCFLFKWRV